MKPFFFIIVSVFLASCNNGDTPDSPPLVNPESPKAISYSVINTYPHDTSSFTEGFLIYNGELYESTGTKGKSKLIKVDLKTGKPLKSIDLNANYFGEGIAIVNDTIYQLTYQEKVGFMYSVKDFKRLGEFTFASSEGWGMTTNGKDIIASDGTSNLYFYQPGTFRLLRTQPVTESGSLSYNLNELEYIEGYIYANQWQQPYILKIDPASGVVVGKIDITDTWNRIKTKNTGQGSDIVPNGIAYDSYAKKIYITGKNWPEMYEIQLSK